MLQALSPERHERARALCCKRGKPTHVCTPKGTAGIRMSTRAASDSVGLSTLRKKLALCTERESNGRMQTSATSRGARDPNKDMTLSPLGWPGIPPAVHRPKRGPTIAGKIVRIVRRKARRHGPAHICPGLLKAASQLHKTGPGTHGKGKAPPMGPPVTREELRSGGVGHPRQQNTGKTQDTKDVTCTPRERARARPPPGPTANAKGSAISPCCPPRNP